MEKVKVKGKHTEMMRELAWFRYNLRRFLRFSERAARACGVTPQQHQLMLGIAGFTENGRATVSELAEFLQERNNSVVGLVERAAESGLVRRREGKTDRRQVVVTLTPRGEEILSTLTELHHEEVRRVEAGFLTRPKVKQKGSTGGKKAAGTRKGGV
ncbi:MAG: MarR family transcriptional regulator [Acidobacteriaceae bacterium]